MHFDFIVIGGGSGGYAAARTAREHVERVAIIDSGDPLGGLCILRGCMPSKTLIYSAEVLHLAQNGKLFGLDIPSAKADMAALHERKLHTIAEFAEYRQEQLQSDRFTLFRNRAKFTGETEITLDDGTVLTADKIIVATGSTVNFPPVPGLADVPVWTSDDVLELDFVPESVIVLGGGIVACELAQFLNRVGTKVTQIQRSAHILKEVSEEAATVIETVFREEGMELITDTQLKQI
ncbi:MAG: FAD-dependent oxidoreductase, partial [Puniceicoccales bacterium]